MADLSPVLHPVARVVIAHHLLVCVCILARNRQTFHIHARYLQFSDRRFNLRVGVIYSNN
jgi:hypothetical protein